MRKRRNHHAGFKARVVPEAVKSEYKVSELAAEYGVYPRMIHQWMKALLDGAAEIFERGSTKAPQVDDDTVHALHAKIEELAVANDFFVQKAQTVAREVKHGMIEQAHPRVRTRSRLIART